MATSTLSEEEFEILKSAIESQVDKTGRLAINPKQLGEKIFSNAENPVQLLINLVKNADDFIRSSKMPNWSASTSLQEFLLQAFCNWIYSVRMRQEHKTKSSNTAGSSKSSDPASKHKENGPQELPPDLSIDEKLSVVQVALNMSTIMRNDGETWKKMAQSLQLSDSTICPSFLSLVREALNNGTATFQLLSTCVRDTTFRLDFQPQILLQALLLGPLSKSDVETFASELERSVEFREECRRVLLEAETIAKESTDARWLEVVREQLHMDPNTVPGINFDDYSKRVLALLKELKPPDDVRVDKSWAKMSLEEAAKFYYEEHSWPFERLHELVWTVLAQRPEMKEEVLKILSNRSSTAEKEFGTALDSPSWISSKETSLLSSTQSESDLLRVNDKYLNLPNDIAITDVNSEASLRKLDNALNDLKVAGNAIVGLDAEWSSYTTPNKASIVQLAMKTEIFIIDLQPPESSVKEGIVEFLKRLFNDTDVLKIGFSFDGDLKEIRKALPSCGVLAPKELINIDTFVKKLRAQKLLEPAKDKNKNPKLSDLCEQILGRPLNKMETRSVWDRRPLRPSQRRYAALDAYCLLQIFERCLSSANKPGVNAIGIALEHEHQPESLQLFYDDL